MADLKISQLSNATTPLAGTEVLPVVQSGATNKVTVANLTAGRDVAMKSFTASSSAGFADFFTYVTASGNGSNAGTQWASTNLAATNFSYVQQLFNGGTVFYNRYNGPMQFGVNNTEMFTIGTDSNLAVKTAAKGVNFTANTPAAGMTSQLLNWYEEGTWTPTMTSAAGTTTVNASSARYTRVGDHVFVVFRIDYTTDASVGTSDFTIGGLPFTSRGTFNSRGFVNSSNWTGSDYNDGYITIGAAATTLIWAGRAVNQSSRTNAVLLFSADYFAA